MWKWLWRAVICLVACITGWIIYRSIILSGGAFHWDEAAHSLRALQIAADVRDGKWIAFLFDSYRQVYWPPLHSWLCGVAFLIAGPSAVTARTLSVLLFVLTALIVYAAALQLSNARKDVAATIATILFLSSPLAVGSSAHAMLEIPGLFFLTLSLLIYIWLRARPRRPSAYVWFGIALTLTYFTRTNYGILLLMAFAIAVLLDARFEHKPVFSAANWWAILPVAIAFIVWFAYPPKIQNTLAALVNVSWGTQQPYSLAGLLYYPNVTIRLLGSIWQSAAPVVAFFAALRCRANPAIRFLLLVAGLQFILGVLHHTREARLLLPILVPLVLLTGFVLAQQWDASNAVVRWLNRSTALVLCLCAVFTFYRIPRLLGSETYPEVASRIADLISAHDSSLLLGTRKTRPSPALIDWQLAGEKRILPLTTCGMIIDLDEYRKFARSLPKYPMPASFKATLEGILRESEQPAKLRSLYPDVSLGASNDPEKFAGILQKLNTTAHFDQILVLTPADKTLGKQIDFFAPGINAMGLNHAFTETFPGADVRLDVFRAAAKQVTSLD